MAVVFASVRLTIMSERLQDHMHALDDYETAVYLSIACELKGHVNIFMPVSKSIVIEC